MQVNDSVARAEKHQPCVMRIFKSRPACRGWAASGETWWVGYIFSSYPLIQKGKKKNQSRASSFSRRKVQRNAWSSEKAGGYEIFRLRGKPAASFHFKRLSIRRCHLWRRRRTLERISDGAVMWEKRVTCSADALSWFLTSTSALQRQYSWTFQLFLPLHTGEDFKTLFSRIIQTSTLEEKR